MSAYITVGHLLTALSLETNDQVTRDALGSLIVRVSGEFDRVMGFAFPDEYITARMDGPGIGKLYLPAPGAADIMTVLEDDVLLDPTVYEVEPSYGRYLLRLDASGKETWWSSNSRAILVQFTPNAPPPDLVEFCIRECVRAWNGRAAGYTQEVGVQGSNARKASPLLSGGTVEGLERLARTYGIRNMVAI